MIGHLERLLLARTHPGLSGHIRDVTFVDLSRTQVQRANDLGSHGGQMGHLFSYLLRVGSVSKEGPEKGNRKSAGTSKNKGDLSYQSRSDANQDPSSCSGENQSVPASVHLSSVIDWLIDNYLLNPRKLPGFILSQSGDVVDIVAAWSLIRRVLFDPPACNDLNHPDRPKALAMAARLHEAAITAVAWSPDDPRGRPPEPSPRIWPAWPPLRASASWTASGSSQEPGGPQNASQAGSGSKSSIGSPINSRLPPRLLVRGEAGGKPQKAYWTTAEPMPEWATAFLAGVDGPWRPVTELEGMTK